MNILVIGSANADMVIHTDRMAKLGETVIGHDFSVNAGGKGLNQAVAIAKLGGNVAFFGAVGKDYNGDLLINTLAENKVGFVGVRPDDHPTGIALITVVNGDNFILLNGGANDAITSRLIESNSELIKNADYIVLQLEIPIEAIVKIIELGNELGAKIILNPAPYKELPKDVYSKIDYLIPNEHEAKDITGITLDSRDNCIKAVKKLKEMGAKGVIITLGEQGCVYSHNDEICFCPAIKSNAVDTTSAGDSFIGALTVKLSQGEGLPDAINFASKVASITVSRRGAAKSIPYASEINI